jgi:hypothetical protein
MLKNYLKLKITLLLKSVNRSLDFGFLSLALLGFLYFFKVENSNWYALVSIGVIFLYHFLRKDLGFLKNVLGKEFYFIIVTEYLLIWLFINAFFIFKTENHLFLLSFLGCFFLPFISFKKYFFNPFFIKYIPKILIEWKSYFRRKLAGFLLFIVFSAFLGYHPATLFLCLFLWINYILIIYAPTESKELLIAQFSKIGLRKKCFYSSVFCVLLSLPMFMVYLFLNYSQPEYLVYFILYIFLANYTIITHKYFNFNEKSPENPANESEFFKHLLLIITIVPALLSIYHNRKEAEKKIKNYV